MSASRLDKPGWLAKTLDDALVSFGAGQHKLRDGEYLPPRLWEALRLELQRRYRLATGEEQAVLRVEQETDAQREDVNYISLGPSRRLKLRRKADSP